jgi:hypothetical protein
LGDTEFFPELDQVSGRKGGRWCCVLSHAVILYQRFEFDAIQMQCRCNADAMQMQCRIRSRHGREENMNVKPIRAAA